MIVALNNKSNFLKEDFLQYIDSIKKIETNHQLILIPVDVYLPLVDTKHIPLGSQNVSSFDMGAHTGRVSASQLKSLDVSYTIVGHSEERKELNETNEMINSKIKELLKYDIIPILCVGETYEEKNANQTALVIKKELLTATLNLTDNEKEKLIIAYEPRWAIGSNIIPTAPKIEEVIKLIKDYFPKNKVLYGGSVNLDTIEEVNLVTNLDGFLLGGISLKPDSLRTLLDNIK